MPDADWLIRIADVEAALPEAAEPMRYAAALRHGTMRLGLYAPRGADIQTPHKQDELYVIAAGSGVFMKAGERSPFRAGDVVFVEAGVEHRFEDCSADFTAWVIFWGPEGGEVSLPAAG